MLEQRVCLLIKTIISCVFWQLNQKVAGTSGSFEKREKHPALIESENSSNSSGVENNCPGAENNSSNLQIFIPQAPPQFPDGSMRKRRRKEIPQRAPLS